MCPPSLNSPECEKLQRPKIWRCFEASSIISMQDLSFVIYTAAYLFDSVLLHDTCATENKDLLETSHKNPPKLLSVRSRSQSYLLHSCSTGTETSRHYRDPQQNWVTIIGDDLLQEHDWKSVFDNRHLAIYNVKHIRWLMRPSELLIHAGIYFAPAPFLWGVCFQDIDRNNICWPTKHWFPKEVDIVCKSSTKISVHKFKFCSNSKRESY